MRRVSASRVRKASIDGYNGGVNTIIVRLLRSRLIVQCLYVPFKMTAKPSEVQNIIYRDKADFSLR